MSESTHIVAGIHSVKSALQHSAEKILDIWHDAKRKDKRLQELVDEANKLGLRLHPVDKKELETKAKGVNHQGIVALTNLPQAKSEKQLWHFLSGITEPLLILVLDTVQDPHNLGACLRTANAAGVHAVIAPKDKSVGLTPVACKIASGAAEITPFFQVTNLVRALKTLQKDYQVWTIGTSDQATKSIYEAPMTGNLALIMGNEEKGLRRMTIEQCDHLVSMPMVGTVESLNVSVATGVVLFEAMRQRKT